MRQCASVAVTVVCIIGLYGNLFAVITFNVMTERLPVESVMQERREAWFPTSSRNCSRVA